MITITYTDENGVLSVTVKGHAGSAPRGEDLVCAGATMLAYTLAQNVRDKRRALKGRPKIQLNEGDIIIRCRPKDRYFDRIKATFEDICTGYRLMAHNFPDCIQYQHESVDINSTESSA